MAKIDLTAYAAKPLTLTIGDWEIVSPVPDAATGKILNIINMTSTQMLTKTEEWEKQHGTLDGLDLETETAKIYEEHGLSPDFDLTEALLGAEQVKQLRANHVSEDAIGIATQYALYYWIAGKEAADQFIEATRGDQKKENQPPNKPALKQSKTGHHTGSGNQTRKPGSTRTTGNPRKKNAPNMAKE